MGHKRPGALTFLCWLIILSSFVVTPLGIAGLIADYPDLVAAGHQNAAIILIVFAIAAMSLGPLSAFYMLKARNWARWLYVVLVLLDAAAVLLLYVKGELFSVVPLVRAAITAPIVFVIVFLPATNRYFAAADKPWWRLAEEEE